MAENKSKLVLDCSKDLSITGVLIGKQADSITYTSKKTSQQVEANRDILILQCPFGIVLCRSFSSDPKSAAVAEQLVVGDTLTLPVTSYSIESGMKSASVRLV